MDPGLLGLMCPDEGAGDARGPGAWGLELGGAWAKALGVCAEREGL